MAATFVNSGRFKKQPLFLNGGRRPLWPPLMAAFFIGGCFFNSSHFSL
jgi:hypothetical protein